MIYYLFRQVGPNLQDIPEGTTIIDAEGQLVMPGMCSAIDNIASQYSCYKLSAPSRWDRHPHPHAAPFHGDCGN